MQNQPQQGTDHQINYGQVPSSSTARIMPAVRPESTFRTVTITPPTTIPQPLKYAGQLYEQFEMPRHVAQPNYFAEQAAAERPKSSKCPVCFMGITFSRLQHDPSDTVFCGTCRQPYHFCRIHNTPLAGMGLNYDDPTIRQCQCRRSQAFLQDNQWNSCFN
jgi:hypothetical protein